MSTITLEQAIHAALEHHRAGRLQQAEAIYRQVLAVDPNRADALHLLGVIAHQVGQNDVAEELISRAITINPSAAEYHNNLGEALRSTGKLEPAIASYRRAIDLAGNYPDAWNNLGACLHADGQFQDAASAFRQAIKLRPDFAQAYCNLGGSLQQLDDADAAAGAFRNAIAIKPDLAEAHNNLGYALLNSGRLHEAIIACNEAICLRPDMATAYATLGGAYAKQAWLDEAIDAYRKAIALNPNLRTAHQNLLIALSYHPEQTARAVFDEHLTWAKRHAQAFIRKTPSHQNDRNPERRLRVGYVSPDFYRHSVAFFSEPLLTAHDRDQIELFCYSDTKRIDGVYHRFRAIADHFFDANDLNDDELAKRIQSDEIDILIDLAGHTADNRLLTFARKPAPVQVTYLGYPNTTGLSAIDYRITDALADPPGLTDAFYTEKLVRLGRTAWCYKPSADAPAVPSAPPCRANGYVTFGSFNKHSKITPQVMDVWADLLRGATNSRLMLKSSSLRDQETRDRIIAEFVLRGIAADRIEVTGGAMSMADHLASYQRIDIALDTFPYNGTTTTCDAMYMGAPVIALAGQTHVARVGVSLLNSVGLGELIAADTKEYVQIATDLAQDTERLTALRTGMRDRLLASPLMDAVGLAREIESAYRTMWRNWCGSNPQNA